MESAQQATPAVAQRKKRIRKHTKGTSHAKNLEEFIAHAKEILESNPSNTTYSLKYLPKKESMVLRLTDGAKTVLRKFNVFKEFDEAQKFTLAVCRTLTREPEKSIEPEPEQKEKKRKKKK